MLERLFSMFRPGTLYIRVRKNGFDIRHIEKDKNLQSTCEEGFTSEKLLIGDFAAAERCLSRLIRELFADSVISVAPRVLIHQTEMVEGVLSPVEERLLMELAMGSGASRVVSWVGQDLADDEVMKKIRSADGAQ
jgi:hypothetical protein